MGQDDRAVIRNGLLIDPIARRAAPADILIEGDALTEVGPPGLKAPDGAAEIDATDKLIMPGMVNGHTHGHGCLAKGLVEDNWTLELFLNSGPALSGNRTLEDKYLAAQLGAVEMLRKGCTACYDLYFEFPAPTVEGMQAVGQAYRDVGVRAVVAPMVADRNLYQALPGLIDAIPADLRPLTERFMLAPREVTVAQLRKVFESWRFDREEIRPAIAPTIPLHCSDAFMTDCRDLAETFDLVVQTHLAESRSQAVAGHRQYGKSLTAHLAGLGLLSERLSAAHGIWLDRDDMLRLADAGASVVHNPASNMRVGSGLACVRAMLECGVDVGIGTDASCTSDAMNMFEAARLASFISRIQTPDYACWLAADEVLAMATAGSAKALGFADVGRIAPGFKADIVLLDARHINYVPLNDPLRQVAFSENAAAVHTVIIGGRTVLEAGRLLTADEDKLRRDAQAAVERLRGMNTELRRMTGALQDIVGGFCLALAREPFPLRRFADGCDG